MFGHTRWSPFNELVNFQREVDRLFNQFWSDLPARTANWSTPAAQVHTSEDGWRIDVPLPGIDPADVDLEVAGSTLSIRVKQPEGQHAPESPRFEQTFTVPQFLDVERLRASHRHGMLQLTLPLKESVKPRRIQIEASPESPKRLGAAA